MNIKKLRRWVVVGVAAGVAAVGLGVGALAESQSTTDVTALDQSVNTQLAASEKLPHKLFDTTTKLNVKVTGSKSNYTVTYTQNGQTVLTLKKVTKTSEAAASSAAAPDNPNPSGKTVSLTTKAKNAKQQGVMGQSVLTWKNGNWQVTLATITASNVDGTKVAKTLSQQLTAANLPSADNSATITLTAGSSSSENQATWSDDTATYTLTASNYKVLVNALTSFK